MKLVKTTLLELLSNYRATNGWKEVRQKGSHHILQKDGFPVVVVPVHGNEDLKKGLEQSLLKDLGITLDK